MKIVEIHVEGFGKLRDRTLRPEGPLTVVYGANEAGKSTLLSFVRAILFGFPTRANAAARCEPPGGGVHGGSLTLLTAAGETLRVSRRTGAAARGRSPAGGLAVVTLADGTTGGEELLAPHFGGVTGEQFRSLFAFGLDELQELRTLTGDELGGYLYSAGLGLRASAVLATERRLAQEMDGLYKPRGKNQEMSRLLKAVEELEAAVRRSKADIGRYEGIAAELCALEAEIADTDRRLREAREGLLFLEAAEQARSHWLRREAVRQELSALAHAPRLTADAANRHESLLAERERLLAELDALGRQASGLEAALAAPAPEERLLAKRALLDELAEQLGAYRSAVRQAEELAAERERLQEKVDAVLGHIDPSWGEETLARHVLTLHSREEAERFRERWKQSANALTALREEAAARRRLEQEARAREQGVRLEYESAAADFDASFGREVRDRRQAVPGELQELRRDVQQALRVQSDLARLEAAHGMAGPLPSRTAQAADGGMDEGTAAACRLIGRLLWAAVVLGAGVPGLLLLAGQPLPAAASFALLLGAAGYLLAERRSLRRAGGRKRRPGEAETAGPAASRGAEALRRELQQLGLRLEQRLSALSLAVVAAAAAQEGAPGAGRSSSSDFLLDERLADALESAAGRLLEALRELALRQERWKEAARQAEEAKQQRLAAEERSARQAERHEALLGEWRAWFGAFGLTGELSPDAVQELFRLIEQGQELLRQKERTAAACRAILADISDYERRAALALGALGEKPAAADIGYALRQAREAASRAVEQQAERRRQEAELSRVREQAELRAAALERVNGQMRALWQEAEASDEAGFRKALERCGRRERLEEELLKLDALLEAGVGSARIRELDGLMRTCGSHSLNRRLAELRAEAERLEAQAAALWERKGRLANERDKLERGEEHADRLQRLQEETAKLDELTARWATLAFCSGLFRQARQMYERERQPGVLKRASAYFARMTGGRYGRIIAPVGEKRLLAELAATGERIDSTLLSRGTAEQLYLAMRFALADEYAKRAILPVLMDDIFVNFDGDRLQRSLEVLGEFSRNRQVLLFTCHAHIAEGCRKAVPDCRIIPFS